MSSHENPSDRTLIVNRRGGERTGACAAAALTYQNDVIQGVLQDVSSTGARFLTSNLTLELPESAWVTISFHCFRGATRGEIGALARIVWRKGYHDGTCEVRVFGVRFDDEIDLRRIEFTQAAKPR